MNFKTRLQIFGLSLFGGTVKEERRSITVEEADEAGLFKVFDLLIALSAEGIERGDFIGAEPESELES